MSGERWRAAGVADPRAAWFSNVARWSTAAAIPVDFVKCVSADELRTRLVVGETYAAVLVGSDVAGVDQSLISEARDRGAAVIVVGDSTDRGGSQFGASAVLPPSFERDDLMAALAEHAAPVATDDDLGPGDTAASAAPWRGLLVCVTGAGGVGSSLMAMCLAGALAGEASNRGLVLLADFSLNADQAMMHDSRDVFPGVQELSEACAGRRLTGEALRSMVFEPAGRGYHLLLGLRRHRDWTAIRNRSLEVVLDSLLCAYRFVVADVDADTEGLSDTGSADVGNRNVMARTALRRSDLTVVVGTGETKGLCSLVRTIDTVAGSGADADRILPVVNRLSRSPKRRFAAAAAFTRLLDETAAADVGDPLLIAERRSVERAIRDGLAPPASLGRSLAAEARRQLLGTGPRIEPVRGHGIEVTALAGVCHPGDAAK